MYKICDKAINIIEETIKSWKVELTAGGKCLAVVKIRRCIFQGDALSPILLVIGNAQVDRNFQNQNKIVCQRQKKNWKS